MGILTMSESRGGSALQKAWEHTERFTAQLRLKTIQTKVILSLALFPATD